MSDLLARLSATLGPDAMTELWLRWVPSLAAAVVTVLVFVALSWLGQRVLRAFFARAGLDRTAAAFIQTVARLAIFTVGTLAALDQLGVDTTSILASLGVVGLAFGLAAQSALSNIISGLFLLWDRPFVIGDLVEIDGTYGKVDRITLRSTRLITADGKMVALPNTVVANGRVTSYTNFPSLRIDIEVTVGVNESIPRVRQILLGLLDGDDRFLDTPAPTVVVKTLGDYFVGVELRGWIADETAHVMVRFELREKVKAALDAAGVVMPYETLQIEPLTVVRPAAAQG